MAKSKSRSESISRILAPLSDTFFGLQDEDQQHLSTLDPVLACIELLKISAKNADWGKLDRMLRLYQAQEALAEVAGGLVGVDVIATRLGLSRQEVLALADSGQLITVNDLGRTGFPSNQITDKQKLVGGLPEVLQLLNSLNISGWMAVDVLNSPFPELGLSPMELLHAGRTIDAMKCIDSLKNQGAA